MSYVRGLHTIKGCRVAGVHIDDVEIVRRFIGVVRNECFLIFCFYNKLIILRDMQHYLV